MARKITKSLSRMDMLRELARVPGTEEILEHPLFLSMKEYRHHGDISCYDHTLITAVTALALARALGADVTATVRAALLHDFYLYDWHTDSPGLHGFKHPALALANAKKYFDLNKTEEDAIRRHMWPLTPIPPRYKESMIVCLADKAATVRDYALLPARDKTGKEPLPDMQ